MEPLIVKSAKLTKIASEEDLIITGKPLLRSLREQKRKKILCDVSIRCRDQQVVAHRCVLYSVSKYCKTLFTGSLPPTCEDGILIMDLKLFTSDTVQVFIDLIYGEEASEVNEVDVGELLRLADYLQVPVNIFTEILRKTINTKNCMALYELSLSYNCLTLQKILESFICNNRKKVMECPSLELTENALSSLQMNPMYLSNPFDILGHKAKEIPKNIDVGYTLITYERNLDFYAKSRTRSVKYDCELTLHTVEARHTEEKEMVYFTFQYELYLIITSFNTSHRIYKYSQQKREFLSMLTLSRQSNMLSRVLLIPPHLPELLVRMVITSISAESVFILFYTRASDLWLMKLNMGKSSEPSLHLERQFFNLNRHPVVASKRTIYFLSSFEYFTYNVDTQSFMRHETEDFSEDRSFTGDFCEYHERIYAFVVFGDHHKVDVFLLDEESSCWRQHSEHTIEPTIMGIYALSSPNEIYLVLDVNYSENEDEHATDYRKSVHCYDSCSKDLSLWTEVESFDDEHLIVPDFLFV